MPTANTLALNYFTPKVFRVTHHDKLKFYNIRPPTKVWKQSCGSRAVLEIF